MLGNRTNLILLGVALAAFLAFVLFGGGGEFSPGPGVGFWGRLFGGSIGGPAGSSGVAPPGVAPPVGALGTAPAAGTGGPAGGEFAGKSAKKFSPKSRRPPDPNLVRRLGGGANLVPSAPPESPREGIVQQTFTVARDVIAPKGQGGPNLLNVPTPEPTPEPTPTPAPTPPNPPKDCGMPKLRKSVIDLKLQPMMRPVFDVPYQSKFIQISGERFTIGDAPAYVIYFPQTKRGSAGAIFQERFIVSISGECIPSRGFLKAQLRQ